ncbi:hypothetical protein BTJ68_14715 [Hortaea werneckii EXF-2000]|uniref:GDP-mannose transporter n=1 Tax=Hortaea werneckii EXF-2000 TaxID=1157616 RepID=A0A1Z5SP12_HORWE|nr:hypothetical protein BTJ68_14715 [Hortaea werneckii EXF-2000]
MCKSSVLAFVLGFAFIFRLERPTLKLCAIITVMTAGVIMMVAGETAFSALGFVLVMCASACSGFRWSLTQILLLRNPSTSNPFSSIFFLTPVMFVALFVLAVPIEGPAALIDGFRTLGAEKGAILGTLIILFPGTLAFAMRGIVFGDELSPINVSGLIVTILSIAAYNYLKYSKMHKQANTDAHHALGESAEGVPLRRSEDRQRGGGNGSDELATHPRSSQEGLLDEDRSSRASFDEDNGGSRAWADGPFSTPRKSQY